VVRPSPIRRNNREAFTLIEILVVITIITILAGTVGVSLFHSLGKSRVKQAFLQAKNLKQAVQLYKTEQGRFPTQEQGLRALVAPATTPPLPRSFPPNGYLDGPVLPKDPWDREYIYLVPGRRTESFEIISYGADGEPGGEGEDADISSSDTQT